MSDSGLLEIRRGKEVRTCAILRPVIAIGRETDNQLVLEDHQVSRHHARMEWVEGVLCITDLGSTNGTLVNNVELEPRVPRPVQKGDIIHIGQFILVVRQMPAAPPTRDVGFVEETVVLGTRACVVAGPAQLAVATPHGTKEFALDKDVLTLGRSPDNDIVVDDPVVSRRHAEIRRVPGGYEMVDAGSRNGILFAGTRVQRKLLADGDVLSVAQSVTFTYRAGVEAPAGAPAAQRLDLRGREKLTIGRHAHNDVVVDHPAISRTHAYLVRRDGGYVIEDIGSINGTFVNGHQVLPGKPQVLRLGDEIRIGPIKFLFEPEALSKVDESRDLRLDALHLHYRVGMGINLLQDISLSIHPSEFVAVVGVSGAGKSTLLNALSGFRPATDGGVLVNGTNLYQNFDAYRTQIGYVPQEDIMHRELSVSQALDYAAQLRLPADTTVQERRQRVAGVLETLDLVQRKDVPIHKLSGGQRKRVSIGVELLTQPG
ncbi:MAG: FHA domain-containing protein, partial [Chloroflexi bacterium]|nr:FHA domain-containing protein [Chloroflexota bacterium]